MAQRSLLTAALLSAGLIIAPALGVPASHAAHPAATPADTLFVAYSESPVDLDPATSYDSQAASVLRGEYEGLVRLRGSSTTDIQGALAQSWTASSDHRVYTFHLRHAVTFHDGTPFTADAVQRSYTRELTLNQGPAFIIGQFVSPKGIKVLDAYTVQFTLNAPSTVFLQAMTSQWGTNIISPTAIKLHPKDLHTWLQSHDAGTGPYMLSSLVPGQRYTLVRYPRYWRGWSGKHVSRILLQIVTADATRRELVARGDADIANGLTPTDMATLARTPSVNAGARYGMRNLSLVMDVYGPLASTAARKAMLYAFDYHAFVTDLLHGYGRQAQGPMPRTVLGHDNSLPLYPTDLTRARALLAQAGVKAGTKLTLWFQAEDEVTKYAAEVLQGQLSQLGLSLSIQPVESTTLTGTFYSNKPASQRPNFVAWYWFPDYNDPGDWLYPQYDSNQTAGAGSNGGYYKNPMVDKLLAQAGNTVDPARRLALYKQVQQALVNDPPAVWLADLPETTAVRRSVQGYVLNPAYTDTYDYYALSK
ncbi:MAG TPA: ABC transporter substrate-binding protein [Chloroflexota bacterium]|nr:ABC transporter substrate-binding protein [Chloroflexota bacterium]